jgi:hypothetical protein
MRQLPDRHGSVPQPSGDRPAGGVANGVQLGL